MPRLLDVRTRTEAVTQAVNHLLALHGASALTLRRIGRECGVGASSLSEHYGTREHLLVVVNLATSRSRAAGLRSRARREGILAFLPRDDDEVLDARAWWGWCELERSHERLSHTMVRARAEDLARRRRRSTTASADPTSTWCWPRSAAWSPRGAPARTRCPSRRLGRC